VLDALRGDTTLFTRDDEVEARWRICEPILAAWRAMSASSPQYPAGSQGPAEAASIMPSGHAWPAHLTHGKRPPGGAPHAVWSASPAGNLLS
jgi:glucose-6-phosphate 1-dehydrogenase